MIVMVFIGFCSFYGTTIFEKVLYHQFYTISVWINFKSVHFERYCKVSFISIFGTRKIKTDNEKFVQDQYVGDLTTSFDDVNDELFLKH